eukprot:CAMPEP_0201974956 /NCGR_PEP_ID=MMETSP0904-20121228/52324_1 /ASSEMBLY_ACC=CAM_ASM_000553 /TAXON_ID=420261 /ORGANISM="Thalassiosira antarctica, Strain CCMP982" /LENGTH=78 /DNA_ID=CAMNT_0048525603 /DNA_START=802 /DNA_END=1035 /DNA_ORIENTATION=+
MGEIWVVGDKFLWKSWDWDETPDALDFVPDFVLDLVLDFEDLDEIGQSHWQTEGDIDNVGDNEIEGSTEGDFDPVGES